MSHIPSNNAGPAGRPSPDRRLWPHSLAKRLASGPQGLLAGSFALVIAVGTILLYCPFSHAQGPVGLLDAFFTATSAVCVTGLITVDTATAWSRAGQWVILGLIQIGGLGIVTYGAVILQLMGRRISIRSRLMLRDSFFHEELKTEFARALLLVFVLTVGVEALGFWALSALMDPGESFPALFHAISAFCNAGFSTFSDSLMRYRGQPLFLTVIMALIVLGGLGHLVILEMLRRAWRRILRKPATAVRLSLSARSVLRATGVLLLIGFIAFVILGLARERQGFVQTLLDAAFQSVTARTAGFNTVDLARLPMA